MDFLKKTQVFFFEPDFLQQPCFKLLVDSWLVDLFECATNFINSVLGAYTSWGQLV